MGRSSFELHSRPNTGLFDELKNQGHDIIKIVLSNQWETIPEEHQEKEENNISTTVILCHNWKEVKSSVFQLSHFYDQFDIGNLGFMIILIPGWRQNNRRQRKCDIMIMFSSWQLLKVSIDLSAGERDRI